MKPVFHLLLLVHGASASRVRGGVMVQHTMAEGTKHKHTTAVGVPFGPQSCAALTRSAEGTCMIRTNCNGVDLSKFEFAFDCDSSGTVQRHSFGVGGFDDEDEFDTSVKCSECLPPGAEPTEDQVIRPHHNHHELAVEKISPATAVLYNHQDIAVVGAKLSSAVSSHKVVPVSHTHHEVVVANVKLSSAGQAELKADTSTKAEAKSERGETDMSEEKDNPTPPENASKFGPGNCISAWRNDKTGTCIMQTDCKGENTADHMFGLICKDSDDESDLVRHTFGKDSFEAKETFDTLIPCKACLSMNYVKEEENGDKNLADMVKELAGVVGSVKDGMKDLKSDVAALNNEVFKKEDGKKEAKEEDAEKEDGKAEAGADAATSLADARSHEHVTIQKPTQLRGNSVTDNQEGDSGDTPDEDDS